MKIPLTTLLLVLFIGLKLTGYITWSWVWVLSPFWVSVIVYILAMLFSFFLVYVLSNNGVKVKLTNRKKTKV